MENLSDFLDISSFVQKPYLKISYNESDIKEIIDMNSQYEIENLPDSISDREPAKNNYVDNNVSDPGMVKKPCTCQLYWRKIS